MLSWLKKRSGWTAWSGCSAAIGALLLLFGAADFAIAEEPFQVEVNILSAPVKAGDQTIGQFPRETKLTAHQFNGSHYLVDLPNTNPPQQGWIAKDDVHRVVDDIAELKRRIAAAPPEQKQQMHAKIDELAALETEYGELDRQHKWRESLTIGRRLADGSAELCGAKSTITADKYQKLADRLEDLGDYPAARKYFEQALAIRREVLGEKHADTAASLNGLGIVAADMGDYAAARKYYEEALPIERETLGEKYVGIAALLNNLGNISEDVGDYPAARKYFEEALAIQRETVGEKHPDTAAMLNNLGAVSEAVGEYATARRYFEQALAIRRETLGEKHSDTARALDSLGVVADDMGDYAAAHKYYEQALAIQRESLGDKHIDTATSLNNLGKLAADMGDYAAAHKYHEQALAIRREVLGDKHADTAASLDNLGTVACLTGDYAAGRRYYEQALAIRSEALGKKHADTAMSFNNLGNVAREMGDYAAARNFHEQALAIKREVLGEKHASTAGSLNNLGNIAEEMGDFAAARKYYELSLAVRREISGEKNADVATSLNNLGSLAAAMADFPAARKYFGQALALRRDVLGEEHPDYAQTLKNLADLDMSMRDYSSAEPLICQAIKIVRRQLDMTAAVQSERQQLRMAETMRWYLGDFLSLADDGKLPAETVYPEVLAWKGAVSARQQAIRRLRQSVAANGSPQTAQWFDELERSTRELSNLSLAVPKPGQEPAHRLRLTELSDRIEHLEQNLADVSREFRDQLDQRRRTPEDLRRALPADAVLVDLLEYSRFIPAKEKGARPLTERRLAAFVVRPDKPVQRIELGPVAPIAAAIESWRKSSGIPGADHESDPAEQLRRLVWDKLQPHLGDAKTVLLSPDGASARFPWPALPGKAQGSYLIEEFAIAVVPIPRLLPELLAAPSHGGAGSANENQAPSLLVVGDVNFDADPGRAPSDALAAAAPKSSSSGARGGELWHWPELPGSRTEMVAIADSFDEQFPDAPLKKLRKDQATKSRVVGEMDKARFLHFATHGFFAPPALRSALAASHRPATGDQFSQRDIAGFHPGLLSGLVLAGANQPAADGKDDGILTALEVAQLDLSRVDLATLSACETGLGETAGGEGLLGLQRAFQASGAKSVVATLWTINDDASRSLMIDFYENLWKKKMSKLEALRQAQLSMLRDGVKRGLAFKDDQPPDQARRLPPYYWAAFVLSGDWR